MKTKLLRKIRNRWSIAWEEDKKRTRKDLNRIVFGSTMYGFLVNESYKRTRQIMINNFWKLCLPDIKKHRNKLAA